MNTHWSRLALPIMLLLLTSNILLAQEDYDFYLQKARQRIAEGDCDGAQRNYNVYMELAKKTDKNIEYLIEECVSEVLANDSRPINNGILLYQWEPVCYCDGIYDPDEPRNKNGHAFHTSDLNINRKHFRIIFSCKILDDYKMMFRGTENEYEARAGVIIAFSSCRRFVLYVHEDGYIYISTDNHNNTYSTNMRFSTNKYMTIDLEYDHGVLIFNGKRMSIEMNTSKDYCYGHDGFHSLDYSCGDAFHGYIKDVKIYSYPD